LNTKIIQNKTTQHNTITIGEYRWEHPGEDQVAVANHTKSWFAEQDMQVATARDKQLRQTSQWAEYEAEDGSGVYYYNGVTGEAQWEKPDGFDQTALQDTDMGALTARSQALRTGRAWKEMQDGADGVTFYYNQKTGESQWDKPEGFDQEWLDANRTVLTARSLRTREIASEWDELFDPETQTTFYYNNQTGESRWSLPPQQNLSTHDTSGGVSARFPQTSRPIDEDKEEEEEEEEEEEQDWDDQTEASQSQSHLSANQTNAEDNDEEDMPKEAAPSSTTSTRGEEEEESNKVDPSSEEQVLELPAAINFKSDDNGLIVGKQHGVEKDGGELGGDLEEDTSHSETNQDTALHQQQQERQREQSGHQESSEDSAHVASHGGSNEYYQSNVDGSWGAAHFSTEEETYDEDVMLDMAQLAKDSENAKFSQPTDERWHEYYDEQGNAFYTFADNNANSQKSQQDGNELVQRAELEDTELSVLTSRSIRVMPASQSGWQQLLDPVTGLTYYWNENTGETSWDPEADNQELVDDNNLQLDFEDQSNDHERAYIDTSGMGPKEVLRVFEDSLSYNPVLQNKLEQIRVLMAEMDLSLVNPNRDDMDGETEKVLDKVTEQFAWLADAIQDASLLTAETIADKITTVLLKHGKAYQTQRFGV
jgi:hypothetical protein